jgi:hypothetical protein
VFRRCREETRAFWRHPLMLRASSLRCYPRSEPSTTGTRPKRHDWDFWLVGTEIDDVVRNQYSDAARPGLTTNNPRYRIWVMSWGQLLDQAERRVQAFRSALELVSTEGTSREYLQRKHAEFIPPLAAGGGPE